MPDSYYAIIVRVPEPQNTCFIAMPFGHHFDDVYTAIEKAANRAKLQAVRTDVIREKPDFVQAIFAGIQSAWIVVAVCSPEPGTNKPNSNVMYEVGLAHALGKPTVLMTSDLSSLPSDIRNNFAFGYDPGEANPADIQRNQVFIQRIELELRERKAKSTNKLTDEIWADRVSLAYHRHRMLLDPDYWDKYRTLLSFGKTIHDEIQQIDSGQMDFLLAGIKDIVFSESDQLKKIGAFTDRYADYNSYYQLGTKQRVFDCLPDMLTETNLAFQYLLTNADDNLKPRVRKAYGFYEQVKTLLNESLELHQNVQSTVGNDLVLSLQDRQKAATIYSRVSELSHKTKFTIIQADQLIVQLINIIV